MRQEATRSDTTSMKVIIASYYCDYKWNKQYRKIRANVLFVIIIKRG